MNINLYDRQSCNSEDEINCQTVDKPLTRQLLADDRVSIINIIVIVVVFES